MGRNVIEGSGLGRTSCQQVRMRYFSSESSKLRFDLFRSYCLGT